MRKLIVLVLLMTCLAGAQENADLDLIPRAIGAQPKSSNEVGTRSYQHKIQLEETGTLWSNRQDLLVPVPVNQPNSQSLTSLDYQGDYHAGKVWDFHLSDRFNLIAEDDITPPNQGNIRNDLREVSATAELNERFYLQAGRVNVRNGIALGYNPTDFFKVRSSVLQSSIDPSNLRENRLGVAQVSAQKIFESNSVSIVAAPSLQASSAILNSPTSTFDPRFGQTNDQSRLLVSATTEVSDFSPQVLFFNDQFGGHGGLNVSHVVGSSFVFYGEWAGGNMPNLTTRALQFGQSTSSLPSNLPNIPQSSTASSFANDVSLGGSWTSSQKWTLNLEYHYHQSGFSANDMSNWVSAGQTSSLLAQELWFIREYASDQQEPLTQSEVFLRLDCPDFLFLHHNLDWIDFINPYDGSMTTQISSQYLFNDRWTGTAYLTAFLGPLSSEKGSLPVNDSVSLKVGYYF